MPVRKRSQHAFVVGQGCEKDVDVEDLMRCKKVIEGAGGKALRYSVCTIGARRMLEL